jgi:hypothetical protein
MVFRQRMPIVYKITVLRVDGWGSSTSTSLSTRPTVTMTHCGRVRDDWSRAAHVLTNDWCVVCAVLQRFEPYGGLLVRNALYGSSGFVNSPQVRAHLVLRDGRRARD